MHDKGLVLELPAQIEDAAAKIEARFGVIGKISDLTDSETGIEKMQVITVLEEDA